MRLGEAAAVSTSNGTYILWAAVISGSAVLLGTIANLITNAVQNNQRLKAEETRRTADRQDALARERRARITSGYESLIGEMQLLSNAMRSLDSSLTIGGDLSDPPAWFVEQMVSKNKFVAGLVNKAEANVSVVTATFASEQISNNAMTCVVCAGFAVSQIQVMLAGKHPTLERELIHQSQEDIKKAQQLAADVIKRAREELDPIWSSGPQEQQQPGRRNVFSRLLRRNPS